MGLLNEGLITKEGLKLLLVEYFVEWVKLNADNGRLGVRCGVVRE